MKSEHSHAWTVVMLGEEPVGISCPCGASRALDREPMPEDFTDETWNLEIGKMVTLKFSGGGRMRGVVHAINMHSRSHEPGETELLLRTY